jgi:uncharacterized YccA/Bax inhibitor family protein
MLRSANPALSSRTFDFGSYERAAAADAARQAGDPVGERAAAPAKTMTLSGTALKTLMLVGLVTVAAAYTWSIALPETPPADGGLIDQRVLPWVIGGALGGFVVGLVAVFWKRAAPVLAPLYAALEGLFLGGISAMFEASYPGIALQAVLCTFGTLAALLIVYLTGLIKPTENVKLGIAAATGGVFLVYLFTFIFSLFTEGVPLIHQSGPIGIGFSVVVIIIAALNLVLDFDFIEQGVEKGAPRYMEWYAAFGLLVTLVWLYIEFLRLLAKLRER